MKKKQRLSWLVLLAVVVWLIGCNENQKNVEESTFSVHGDTIYVLNDENIKSELKTQKVDSISYSKEVVTTGTVKPIPTQYAYIAPPFAGRIIKSYIQLGQKVVPNTPLFQISSPEFTATQKEYYQAKSEKELAGKELTRKENLLQHGVTSQKEYEETLNLYQITEHEYKNALAALEVYQVNPSQMTLGQPLTVYAPIAGEVIENNIVVGQYISADSEPLAIIADLSEVWVTAQVKEKDIRFIHKGDKIDILLDALPNSSIHGNVFHIQEAVDEETRSTKVLSLCDNKDGQLKIGMFTTVHFYDKPEEYFAIPTTALLQGENNTYVMIESGDNTFVKRNVHVETIKDDKALIKEGLSVDDIILYEGAYYLPQIQE